MIEDFFRSIIHKHTRDYYLSFQNVGGGCINNAAKLETANVPYFIKWNSASQSDLFDKESRGLELLRSISTIRTPKVLGRGTFSGHAYLLLEWIDQGYASGDFWEHFGRKLAIMHQNSNKYFGLDHDNHIGRLPQSNRKHPNWHQFFMEERLLPQIKLALQNKLINAGTAQKFESLFKKLPDLVPNEKPALLHGDLWSGNLIPDQDSQPVLIDPAIHFGHRETELAFTSLFGGFNRSFYDFYNQQYPLAPGFEERIDLHNLYPLLVHVNLFGTSYLSGILQTLKRFA